MSATDFEKREARPEKCTGTMAAVRQLFSAIGSDLARGASRITGGASSAVRGLTDTRLLGRRGTGRKTKAFIGGGLLATGLMSLAAGGAMLWALHDVEIVFKSAHDAPSILIEAADGAPLGRVGGLGDHVKREEIPAVLVDAVLAIEDRRFYDHWGIDPRGILRAAYANWSAGGIAEGGSTITQQLAKMQLVGNERSFVRKSREALLALWLESRLGKDEILKRYMNSVYLGAGVYGMSAAARQYFDKSLHEITLNEAAMLAGLIQAPSRFNPMVNASGALKRAAVVVDAMLEAGAIDEKSAAAAKSAPAVVRASPRTAPAESWFTDWIARHEFGKVAGVTSRPMRVRTTLDPRVQTIAAEVVDKAIQRSGASLGVSQAALVAMKPDGSVVAMVGGRNYQDSQFNRAVDARRQPGSTFKLFVFYAALRHGYSPHSVVDASPIEIRSWRPENYGGQSYGSLTLADAFAQSVNTAAVRLALDVGLSNVVAAARELGLSAPLAEVPSMALGTNDVSLLDLTGAFASISAGRKLEPWGIRAFAPEGSGLRELSPGIGGAARLPYRREIEDLLRRVVTSGTGRGAGLRDDPAFGKTGTSQDYRDAWFVGYSRDLVVGVWVGNDDRTPMNRVTGGSLPATIWREFVEAATPALGRPQPERQSEAREMAAVPTPAQSGAPSCDIRACAAAYSSFRAADCTYQPYAGPRRLCEWLHDAPAPPAHIARAAAASPGSCAADLCARRFRSFDPATCTYQPYGGGPRAFCDSRSVY